MAQPWIENCPEEAEMEKFSFSSTPGCLQPPRELRFPGSVGAGSGPRRWGWNNAGSLSYQA